MIRTPVFLISFFLVTTGCGAMKSNRPIGATPSNPTPKVEVVIKDEKKTVDLPFLIQIQTSSTESFASLGGDRTVDCNSPCQPILKLESKNDIQLDRLRLVFTSDIYPSGRPIPVDHFKNIKNISANEITFELAGFEEWLSAERRKGKLEYEYPITDTTYEKGAIAVRLSPNPSQIKMTSVLHPNGFGPETPTLKSAKHQLFHIGTVTLQNLGPDPISLQMPTYHVGHREAVHYNSVIEPRKYDATQYTQTVPLPAQKMEYLLFPLGLTDWESAISLNRTEVHIAPGASQQFFMYTPQWAPRQFQGVQNTIVSSVISCKVPATTGGFPNKLAIDHWSVFASTDRIEGACYRCLTRGTDCLRCIQFQEETKANVCSKWDIQSARRPLPTGTQRVDEQITFQNPLHMKVRWESDEKNITAKEWSNAFTMATSNNTPQQ